MFFRFFFFFLFVSRWCFSKQNKTSCASNEFYTKYTNWQVSEQAITFLPFYHFAMYKMRMSRRSAAGVFSHRYREYIYTRFAYGRMCKFILYVFVFLDIDCIYRFDSKIIAIWFGQPLAMLMDNRIKNYEVPENFHSNNAMKRKTIEVP